MRKGRGSQTKNISIYTYRVENKADSLSIMSLSQRFYTNSPDIIVCLSVHLYYMLYHMVIPIFAKLYLFNHYTVPVNMGI